MDMQIHPVLLVLLAAGHYLTYPIRKVIRKHKSEFPPPPLKPRRWGRPRRPRRSITPSPASRKQYMQQPTNTGLFSLPPEIRALIWNYVLPSNTIYLCIMERKLRGWLHDEVNVRGIYPWVVSSKKFVQYKDLGVGVLGALRSCRQGYAEIINILYTNSTFLPYTADTLAYLPTLIPHQRFNSIRTLRFRWRLFGPPSTFPPDPRSTLDDKYQKNRMSYLERWQIIWKTVSEMQGLRYLTIELRVDNLMAESWEVEELDIVKTITGPEEVVIVLWGVLYEKMVGRIGGPNCRVVEV